MSNIAFSAAFPNSYESLMKLSSLFDKPFQETSKCFVPWNQVSDSYYNQCINKYSQESSLTYRIIELVKSIFGRSDWQNARNRLAGYFACVHYQSEPQAGRAASCIIDLCIDGYYHYLAENLLRFKTGYGPLITKDRFNDNSYWIDSLMLNLKGRKQWNELPSEKEYLSYLSYDFKKLFNCLPSDFR